MNSKIYYVFLVFYQYLKVSVYWWFHLLKRIFIYGLVPAGCALFLTIEELLKRKDQVEVKEVFKKNFQEFSQYKIQSFGFSIILISLWTALYFLNQKAGGISILLTVLILYLLALSLIAYTYCVNYLAFKKSPFKQALMMSMYSMLKNVMQSITVIVIICVLMTVAYMNFAFFFFFGPFLYGISVRLVLRGVIQAGN